MNKLNKLSEECIKEILQKLELNFNILKDSQRINRVELTFNPFLETNHFTDIHPRISNSFTTTIFILPTWIIQGLCETNIAVEQLLQQNTPPASLVQTNLYEGGTQLWECSYDMNEYLTKHVNAADLLVPYFNVLELGCGYGIPSIAILLFRCYHQLKKQTCIVFQDLNKHALKFSTLSCLFFSLKPYYSYNEILDIILAQCEFIYGSWESLALKQPLPMSLKLTHQKNFHLILSCEALYRPVNYEWLETILYHTLNDFKQSKAIFATKRYYFGIGGGSYEFLYFLHRSNPNSGKSESPVHQHQKTYITLDDSYNTLDEKRATFPTNRTEKSYTRHTSLLGRIVYTFRDGRSNIRDILIVEHAP